MSKGSQVRVVVLLAGVMFVLSAAAGGQDWAGRGRVQGVVSAEEDERPIEGARVVLRRPGPEGQGPEPLFTDRRGRWSYLGLRGGAWEVLIEAAGYVPSEGPVRVNEFGAGETLRIRLRRIPEEQIRDERAAAAVAHLERGNELVAEGRRAEARAEYEAALESLEPEHHGMVLTAIVHSYLEEGRAAEAVAALEARLPEAPDADLLRTLARAHFEAGALERSIEVLEQALAAAPGDVATLQLLIDLLVRSDREEEAQGYIAQLPEGATVDPETLLNTGISLFNAGDLEAALAQFERAVAEHPELPDAYYFRGLTYLGLERNEEARADFERLLALAPEHAHAAEARQFLDFLAGS